MLSSVSQPSSTSFISLKSWEFSAFSALRLGPIECDDADAAFDFCQNGFISHARSSDWLFAIEGRGRPQSQR